jgi:hypothetical protein
VPRQAGSRLSCQTLDVANASRASHLFVRRRQASRQGVARKAPVAEHPRARSHLPLGHVPSLPRAEFRFVSGMACSPTSRRAIRIEEESGQTQDVQRPLGACSPHSPSGTLSAVGVSLFFQFGIEPKLCYGRAQPSIESILCGSVFTVLRLSVHLARAPSKCPPRKNAPSNPSFKRTATGKPASAA